jgi:hypothetical protein
MNETGRNRIRITVEEVVYRKERIKHFDREGCEFWAEVDVPDLVEKEVDAERIDYVCPTCNENKTVEERIPE